jgi:Ca-activated chloride channel homolog
MIKLEHTCILYFLFIIPFLVFIYWSLLRWKRKKLTAFADKQLWEELMPLRSVRRSKGRFILYSLAFVFVIIAMANPLIGSRIKKAEQKGVDLMICLDISKSMLASDIKPSRIKNAKQAIHQLIDKLDGDRIGLVIFAGEAYKQLPLTNDYAAAKLFLSAVHPNIIKRQGTDIALAIEKAVSSFDLENNSDKAIVIISDGEDHEGNAEIAAADAKDLGIKVYTLGMGLPEGAPIPEINGNNIQFKKDAEGNTIITKINEKMLQDIASEGGGTYIRANNTNSGLELLFQEINKMEEKTYDTIDFTDFESRFQYPLFIALLLIVFNILIPERKGKLSGKIKLFEEKKNSER